MSSAAQKNIYNILPLLEEETFTKQCTCCGTKYNSLTEFFDGTTLFEVVEQIKSIYLYARCNCGTTLTYKTSLKSIHLCEEDSSKSSKEKILTQKTEILSNNILPIPNNSKVFQLLYVSFATEGTTEGDIKEIVSKSQNRNLSLGVTGAVLFGDGVFIQLLEGERESVWKLFDKIKRDTRHYNISVIVEQNAQSRIRPKAAMQLKKYSHSDMKIYDLVLSWNRYRSLYGKYIQEDNLVQKLLDKFSELIS